MNVRKGSYGQSSSSNRGGRSTSSSSRGSRGPSRGGSKSGRITGFFRSKKGWPYVGKLRKQEQDTLRDLLDKSGSRDIVFFLWKNDREEGKPEYTISAIIDSDPGTRSNAPRDRRIQDDPEDQEDNEYEEDEYDEPENQEVN